MRLGPTRGVVLRTHRVVVSAPPLGNHHADVKRLRALLRDRGARDEHGLFVCEGPRVITAALDQQAPIHEVLVGVDATPAARAVADRAVECFIPVRQLAEGVGARVSATTTAQGVFALVPFRRARPRRAHRRHARGRRAAARRSRQRGHPDPERGGGRRRDNRPRARIGRRVQSQDRAGIGRRVLRSPDRGGCARRGRPWRRSGEPACNASARSASGGSRSGGGRSHRAGRDRARPRGARPRRRPPARRRRHDPDAGRRSRSTSRWPARSCSSRRARARRPGRSEAG